MSDDKESLNATVASLRQAARHLTASIDTTPDRAQKRLLALKAFELLRRAAQLAQQEESTRSDIVVPPILNPKEADTQTGPSPTDDLIYTLTRFASGQIDIHNAVDRTAAPEPQPGLAAYMIHGQEYVANARLIQPGKTYPKVYCVPPTSIGKANIG